MIGVEDRLEGVQRARADVAEDDPERSQRQGGDAGLPVPGRGMGRRWVWHRPGENTLVRLHAFDAEADPLAYPGRTPPRSWVLDLRGEVRWLDEDEQVPENRLAVLAIGSNRRPERLASHLAGASDPLVAGLRVTLEGADIVYPAHIAPYGVCTATIVPCAGAVIDAWLLLVTPCQLGRLAEREGLGRLFDLYRVRDVTARTDFGTIAAPLAFVCRHGPLPFADGEPRRLWRVHAERSPLRRASLRAAHIRSAELLGGERAWPLASAAAADADRRLRPFGLPLGWPAEWRVNDGARISAP